MNFLKGYGDCIKRLVFPDHVPPPTLFEMLRHCSNVTQLSLPPGTEIYPMQLKFAVQHIKNLKKLEVQLSTKYSTGPLLGISGLSELTVHIPKVVYGCGQICSMCTTFVETWVATHFVPCKLNIVTGASGDALSSHVLKVQFLKSWAQWNATIPKGHTACLKLYLHNRSTLNICPVFPTIQLEYGQKATLPLVKASDIGLFSLKDEFVLFADAVHNGQAMLKAKLDNHHAFSDVLGCPRNDAVGNLRILTDLDFEYCRGLKSEHLQQLATACPKLQRLNLQSTTECLVNLEGLLRIAKHCDDLRGLNLLNISICATENYSKLWKILSGMKKLTYLAVEMCVFGICDPSIDFKHYCNLFQKFLSLQGLEFQKSRLSCNTCRVSGSRLKLLWLFVSQFPSLRHCNLYVIYGPDSAQDIIIGCKELTHLSCRCSSELSLSSVWNTITLQ